MRKIIELNELNYVERIISLHNYCLRCNAVDYWQEESKKYNEEQFECITYLDKLKLYTVSCLLSETVDKLFIYNDVVCVANPNIELEFYDVRGMFKIDEFMVVNKCDGRVFLSLILDANIEQRKYLSMIDFVYDGYFVVHPRTIKCETLFFLDKYDSNLISFAQAYALGICKK